MVVTTRKIVFDHYPSEKEFKEYTKAYWKILICMNV